MKKLIVAPCVGIVVGALAEGILFGVLTLLDSSSTGFEWAFLGAMIGAIVGGFIGGLIGLIVALRNSRTGEGMLLGSAIGLGFAILIAIRTGASLVDIVIGPWGDPVENYWTIVALSMIPAGASIGFLSAFSIAPGKEPPATPAEAEPGRSHRIFD